MEFIAFICYMSNKTTVSADRPIFLTITPFTTILVTLMTKKALPFIHIDSKNISLLNHVKTLTNIPSFLFLQNQRTYFAKRRKRLNQQNLIDYMSITIIQSHQKTKNMLLMLSIKLRRLRTTSTSTSTDCERLVISIFIPQSLKFCEIRTHRQ